MLECHYGVPMTQGVLNTLNTRLDAPIIAFSLDHADAKVVIVDRELSKVMKEALALGKAKPLVIDYDDPEYTGRASGWVPSNTRNSSRGAIPTTPGRCRRTSGTPSRSITRPAPPAIRRAWSITTAARICWRSATSSPAPWRKHPVYLWTLPMFHCNGWCFPWSISVVAGTHVCLRAVRAPAMYEAIANHKVTHLCGAPIVMATLLNAPAAEKKPLPHVVEFFTAAAPPPEAVLAGMKQAGFNVTHLYGLTESYGPAVINDWHSDWDALPAAEQAAKKARQGVRYGALEALDVRDPESMVPVKRDGATMGEVMMRGNVVMKGYLKNKASTDKAFVGGWFHTGDLGVMHADGYIQLKDRSKDIIISGGENISSIEVEDALYKHPAVAAVGVVAKPDEKWGETPCAFVELKPGVQASADELMQWCRKHLAAFKCPRHMVFAEIPKTSTGKIQKFKLREMAKAV